ncbi:DUF2129 domain-containing protein [Lactovum miscens]|uniref:Uncharacterized protein YlbG (UPF0298 family) n=1 Tax=Lactovum miscens TaxID=190387 RepID=A0A841C9N9_9LACT|nr:DUF2129 domain-containing protein [Lactovum miscens]MBB5888109.1 uncharacterized protein YlbG (UPF0298 family) [Lactovum miscens]
MNGRKPIYVFFRSKKDARHLSKFGEVVFVSEKKNYACLYLNSGETDSKAAELKKLPFVKFVKKGQMMNLASDFGEAFADYIGETAIRNKTTEE